MIQAKHSFPINFRERFPIVVNPVLFVEIKFAFSFGQEEYKNKNDK